MGLNGTPRRTAGTGAETRPGTGPGAGIGTGPGAGIGTGAGAGIGTGADTDSGAGLVRVNIGELVLDGFDRLDPERVSEAFRSELARLVRERGVPLAADGGRALDALAGLPPLPATTSPRRLGQALARAVHEGLSGRGEPR
ncbi:hypothetical protein [Streptomyces wuyuanensis]|uniref:hypothetical protein n=1 Tax=Streptomyces wuyuanensis TaxID=1196353 RepID=UPI0034407699